VSVLITDILFCLVPFIFHFGGSNMSLSHANENSLNYLTSKIDHLGDLDVDRRVIGLFIFVL
jgi:hypothetical protein